jgi:pentapeptide repeat protein
MAKMTEARRAVVGIARNVPSFVSRHKVWAGIVVVLAFFTIVVYVPRLPFVGPRSGRAAESDFRGHLLQALAGFVLAAGAYYTGRTFALNREGQITERFTRAVEQLADEKLEIRLGGIYALERIARDSETHYEPVMEVLTAFLREHSPAREPGEGEAEPPGLPPPQRVDFQAVATILGRRDRSHERPDYRLSLDRVGLPGVQLFEAHLENAWVIGADFSHAGFFRAHLSNASFSRARLSYAIFREADLSKADLTEADLSNASFAHADLSGASLNGANLSGASFFGASLQGAPVWGTDLRGAIDLTPEQVASLWVDGATKVPEYVLLEGNG